MAEAQYCAVTLKSRKSLLVSTLKATAPLTRNNKKLNGTKYFAHIVIKECHSRLALHS